MLIKHPLKSTIHEFHHCFIRKEFTKKKCRTEKMLRVSNCYFYGSVFHRYCGFLFYKSPNVAQGLGVTNYDESLMLFVKKIESPRISFRVATILPYKQVLNYTETKKIFKGNCWWSLIDHNSNFVVFGHSFEAMG